MTALILALSPLRNVHTVLDLSDALSHTECVCLKACTALCLCSSLESVRRLELDAIELASAEGRLTLEGHGAVFSSHESAGVLETILGSDDLALECLVSNLEGVLDEGLSPDRDFRLVAALPVHALTGLDRSYLASTNHHETGYWCLVLDAQKQAVQKMLSSATKGYLLGARIKDAAGNVIARVVRAAGYDDGDTDLILHDRALQLSGNVLTRF
jgi:hypothetical protein